MNQILRPRARSASRPSAHLPAPRVHGAAGVVRYLAVAAAVAMLAAPGKADAQVPTGWTDTDIGSPSQPGSASYSAGNWSVSGGGADIWGSSDQFNYVYQNTTNNGIVAQVNTVANTDPWAKAGVMMRDNTTAGAMFANVVITPGNGVNFQWRNSTGGQCGYAQVTAQFVPIWVKLVNSSSVFSAYYSNDGTTWTLIGSPQNIPMISSLPLVGLCVTAHNDGSLCTANFASVSLSYLTPPSPPTFGVYRQLWTGLSTAEGNTIDVLTNTVYNPNWPNNPDPAFTRIYTNFETDVNTGMNNYGQRLRAFVIPPTNGNYAFWISSDDTSDLFVSTDETPLNKLLNCWVSTWTDSRNWTKEPNQQGPPVFLQAGQRYYVEAIMQQGGGGDNLAVRWQLPNGTFEEPLHAASATGTYMIPYTGADSKPGIYQQTTNVTVVEGLNALLSVLCTNQSSVSYRWSLNGTNLSGSGAQYPSYSITNVPIAANGRLYRCVLSNAVGVITSTPMTLTVLRDTNPPTVLRALNVGTASVQVVYSKAVEPASATNKANYVFTNGLSISSASLAADNVTVTLGTAPLVYGSNYTVVINGVRDRASIANTIAANTAVTFTALPYASQDIGGPPIPAVVTFVSNNITVTASGSDIGGLSDQFNLNYQPRTGDFDIALCLGGLSLADVWTKAGLMARETLDPGSRFAAALATPTMAGSFFEWRDPANSQANLTGNFPPNFPNAWLRLQRSGNTFTGYASYDGLVWTQLGSAVLSFPSQIYVGLAVSSHNSSQAATAQFIDLSNVTNPVVGQVANPHEPLGPSSRRTPIVISEIMYTPAPRADAYNLEYVELYNSNPYFEDISGFQLVAGTVRYTIPSGTLLGGGAFLVVAASPASMTAVYGITNVAGPYAGGLKKIDTINLLDEQGAILLTVPYSNDYPWPVAAHGTGHSIVLANPTYGEADPRAWAISDIGGGSPGGPEAYRPNPLRNVVINELLAHSENPAVQQFVELYNHSNTTNDLSGCILTDDPSTNKFVIPPGTLIGPAGFVSFSQTQLGFTLNSSGQRLYFINPDRSRVLDAVQFEAQADARSWGRWPDGAADFYPLALRTPGTNNSSIWISDIAINELMYDPISGDDDDQYIELYNKGTQTISLANWQFTSSINFTFPASATLAPNGYLVLARNVTNLFGKYTNLNSGNTLGNYTGKLSHQGERVALAMPQPFTTTNALGGLITNTIYVVQDEVTYGIGGRWGQWAKGGGSSLELINPNTNHRLAYNWADSDETSKSVWTNLEFTGLLDNGSTYNGNPIGLVQVGLLDIGECLVDNLEVRPGGTGGANIVSNGDFQSGLTGWTPQGDHQRSSLETASGLGGYQSTQSLHLRSDDSMWTLADYVQGSLSQTTLASGQTATLRLKARWLHGWPEVLMRLNGNFIEVSGAMPVPRNLGTPGLPNSRYVTQPGPAIYEVKHSPSLPPANTPVVVTARFHDLNSFQPSLLYRVDTGVNPAPAYTSVSMTDDGTGGDALADDGIYSATIPPQPAGTVVAFLVQARDSLSGATTILPADLNDNAGIPRECVLAFGDPIPTGSFSHHHVFITQNWAQQWATWGGVSHEPYDGTWVDGGGRIVYDWRGRYAGSPYHQYLGSPIGTVGGMHWYMPDDDQVFGTATFDKQHVPGNGPLDDDTLQREQAAYWMAHKIGLPRQNRRYYVYYVNGNRHGPLMEDAQVPGTDMLKEYWPNDNNGWLYKNHAWFEGDVALQSDGYMNFNMPSWCTLGAYTTTLNGINNQYKLARYRWMWLAKKCPASANDYAQVFALIDAANTPTTSPAYYDRMEALVDTEEWLRLSAMEHATGDWDSFFTQNQWNMYCYKPTMGKWTALKWDWNITLGSGTQTWPPDGSQLFNVGAADPVMGAFQNYTPYRRAYLRALQDIANLAMNSAAVNPVLDAKYASFIANGLTENSAYGLLVQNPAKPGGLEDWIATMHNSLLLALTNQGVSSVPFAINSMVITNDTAIVTGTAPVAVKTIWFDGIEYPVTWSSVTGWVVTVPLQPGTNQFSVVGVDLHNQPVPGATGTISPAYNGTIPSPVGQVVINEIMFNPVVPDADYVELYNASTNTTFDLSGWQFHGLAYTFPSGSLIYPNSYLLLTANPSAFAEAYGGDIVVFDSYPGSLQNSGELLSLIKPGSNGSSNLMVAAVHFENQPPWPVPIPGSSLQLIDPRQDNWRVGNWATVSTNSGYAPAQWVFVTTNVPATSSRIYIYLGSAGDVYVDDASVVGSAGTNLLANGGFESPLSGTWNLTANFTNSALSTAIKHSGASSLHVVATAAGIGSGNSIYQDISPALTNGATYTLSFWYLQSTNGGPLTVRFSSSSNPATVSIAPALLPALAPATPDATNSPFATLAAFPPLWINELQADNLTGITNSAGQRTAWLELYNPSTNSVSLKGLYLANNYTNLTQWAFPTNAAINPGQFKVIFADGQTSLSTTNEIHTGFVLPSGSGSLALTRLTNAQLQVLDYINYTNLATNYSYGSFPDGQSFVRQTFYHATPGATNDGTAVPPPSFIPFTTAGAVYTQNFNSLPNPGAVSVNSDNPVTINGITYSLANPFDFAVPAIADGNVGGLGLPALAGWYGMADPTASVGTRFGATDGDQTTGGVISFGLPSSSNRAVGLLATTSTGYTGFGAKLINQTPYTLNSITLQFTGELWRQSDRAKTIQFYYFIDPTAAAPLSTNSTAFLPNLNVSFPTVPADTGGVAVDGTASANQISLGVTNQVITNWPPGTALWLVWEMPDATGKAQGLGIDNLSFSATSSQSNANTAPVLATIQDQTVYANTLLTFTASATDTDQPPQTLTFRLGAGAPTGASITSGGVFTWTPAAAQAPGTYPISVIVTDSGVPQMSATNSFNVVVYRPNTAPALRAIPSQTVYANMLLTFTASATDTDQPPQTLTFSLGTGAATGASITSGGVFTWTPTAAQAPSTNTISVIVQDNGQPQMSATNSFEVVVSRPNTAPVLGSLSDQTVYANTLLTFTASATDTDQPPQTLTFSLGAGAPTGASITTNGVFTWTPTAAQAPSTNTVSVIVRDSGVPQMSATNSFKVVVSRPNTAPVLGSLSDQTVYANTLLTFTASATDTDQPPQTLTFSLGAGAPTGASITTNGVFTWTPTAAQAPSTNSLTVTVEDSGLPQMSATNSFSVVVLQPVALLLESASSLNDSFTVESDAVIDTIQETITTSVKSTARFYRLRSQTAVSILSIQVQANQVTLRYH